MKKLVMAAVVTVSLVCFTGMATGVTSINQPTLPYKITTPGSYQLQANLTVPNANTTAILVQTDNVTIDMNGHAILGPNNCTGSGTSLVCDHNGTGRGIDAQFRKNIKVYNGIVRGMGAYGLFTGNGAIIESMRVQSNGQDGIFVPIGTVSGNTASNNGGDGIVGNNGTVSGNMANDNGGNGIFIGSNGTVNGNTANNNGDDGIDVVFGTISGNTVRGNHNDGIRAETGTVSGNMAGDNGEDGISVNEGIVNGNTAIHNEEYGLDLGASAGYVNNVASFNVIDDVNGGFLLGNNLCGSALCP